jgi:hypothetical protein
MAPSVYRGACKQLLQRMKLEDWLRDSKQSELFLPLVGKVRALLMDGMFVGNEPTPEVIVVTLSSLLFQNDYLDSHLQTLVGVDLSEQSPTSHKTICDCISRFLYDESGGS